MMQRTGNPLGVDAGELGSPWGQMFRARNSGGPTGMSPAMQSALGGMMPRQPQTAMPVMGGPQQSIQPIMKGNPRGF